MTIEPPEPQTHPGRRGLVFDAAVLLANVLLVAPLTDLVKSTKGFHPLFGILLVLAVILQTLGAALKRNPLQARLAAAPRPPPPTAAYIGLFVLMVMYYGLFGAALALATEIGQEIFGKQPWLDTLAPFIMLGGALFPIFFTIRAMIPPRRPVTDEATLLQRREFLADLALYGSTLVIVAWWDGMFVEILAGAAKGNWWLSVVLIVLTTVPFAMFYLAPRILFLVEDYRDPKAWGCILLVALSLAKRLVLG